MSNKAWEDYQRLKQEISCCNCKFFDGCCCMYDCAFRAVLDDEKTAKNCSHFTLGEYNEIALEESDYK